MMILELYIFVLAAFTGFMVISRVPPLLHTPLMAATNAISGISLVGSLIMAGAQHSRLATLLGFIAVVDRKSTRLNSSHLGISYAVFCLKKKNNKKDHLY